LEVKIARTHVWLTLMLLARLAEAQTSRGTISGAVTDGAGAVIAGAKLVLTHTETVVQRSTTACGTDPAIRQAQRTTKFSISIKSLLFWAC
jgi:hypothetical protein